MSVSVLVDLEGEVFGGLIPLDGDVASSRVISLAGSCTEAHREEQKGTRNLECERRREREESGT